MAFNTYGSNANALNQAYSSQLGVPTPEVPRTVASAIGKLNSLNERLSATLSQIATISDMIGGPRPAGNVEKGRDAPPSSGAVGHLNDALDLAHRQCSEAEEMLGSIGRALG